MTARSWGDLTGRQKTLLLTMTSVQLSLAATAWVDLVELMARTLPPRHDRIARVEGAARPA